MSAVWFGLSEKEMTPAQKKQWAAFQEKGRLSRMGKKVRGGQAEPKSSRAKLSKHSAQVKKLRAKLAAARKAEQEAEGLVQGLDKDHPSWEKANQELDRAWEKRKRLEKAIGRAASAKSMASFDVRSGEESVAPVVLFGLDEREMTAKQKKAWKKIQAKGREAQTRGAAKPTAGMTARMVGRKLHKAEKEASRAEYAGQHEKAHRKEKKAYALRSGFMRARSERQKERTKKGMGHVSTGSKGVRAAWREKHAARTHEWAPSTMRLMHEAKGGKGTFHVGDIVGDEGTVYFPVQVLSPTSMQKDIERAVQARMTVGGEKVWVDGESLRTIEVKTKGGHYVDTFGYPQPAEKVGAMKASDRKKIVEAVRSELKRMGLKQSAKEVRP